MGIVDLKLMIALPLLLVHKIDPSNAQMDHVKDLNYTVRVLLKNLSVMKMKSYVQMDNVLNLMSYVQQPNHVLLVKLDVGIILVHLILICVQNLHLIKKLLHLIHL
jgi:hypothetical protein